ncbi:MAG: hypothetical protein K5776_09555 [Lachnospiraceae bacterium]|nr:hypothetical protein [Lachnospiraceae bacterium]
MLKRILAIIGIILILACILTTLAVAVLPVPGKSVIMPVMIALCVFLPIIIWIALWMVSFVTGKQNIASMNPEGSNEIFEKDIKENSEESDK